jgi:hypothetical protein
MPLQFNLTIVVDDLNAGRRLLCTSCSVGLDIGGLASARVD